MKNSRLVGAAIAILFLITFAVLTKSEPASWNDMSRVAAIESLVERGTWAIDDSPWVDRTQDKILLDGRFYSDKMPLLSLMGAGVYGILRSAVGATLAPDCAETAKVCAYYWLTLILIGVPVGLLLWIFFDFAWRKNLPLRAAVIGTLALGSGTMIFPFTLVLNHHTPAAVSLFASFYLLTTHAADNRKRLVGAGLLAALAVSFDAISGIVAMSLVGIAAARYRRILPYFLLGAAIPLVVTAFLDYQIAHTIIPPYLITSAYSYPGSAFPATIGGNGTPDDYAAYAFRMFLGAQGLFAYNPLLLFALVGAIVVAVKSGHPLRVEGIFTALGFVLLSIYLAVGTGNLGGIAYGERWFVAAIPVLFAFIFFVPPLNAAHWKNAAWIVFLPLLALSAFSSLEGAMGPWLYTPPPLQLTRKAQSPIFGLRWNVRFP
jgi:hypothetical protein